MATPIRPAKSERTTGITVRLRSLIMTVIVISLYILILTHGHLPTHLPILTH